jgi:hypothetical protein
MWAGWGSTTFCASARLPSRTSVRDGLWLIHSAGDDQGGKLYLGYLVSAGERRDPSVIPAWISGSRASSIS